MVRTSTLALGAVGGLVAAVGAWNYYLRRTTETVPYTTVTTLGDVELRRYPSVMAVETTAPTQRAAFRRLFRYIQGDNDGGEDISMTAPVEMDTEGSVVSMTAPVSVGRSPADEGVRMAFFLPSSYDTVSAPKPTDETVDLAVVPERTLAVRRFSWRPTDDRIDRETDALLDALERAAVPVVGEPFFMGYDAPWTLPMLRRNEVAVQVES